MAATKRKSAARTVDVLAACKDSTTVYEVRTVLLYDLLFVCVCRYRVSDVTTFVLFPQDENGVVWNFTLNYTDISYGSYGYALNIYICSIVYTRSFLLP